MAALLKAPRSRVSAWLRSLEHDAPAISLRSHHVSLIMWDGIATPLTTNALKDFNTNRIDSGFNPLPSSTTDAVGEISKVLKFIRRHLFLLVAGLSFGGLLGFVYMLFQQPIY